MEATIQLAISSGDLFEVDGQDGQFDCKVIQAGEINDSRPFFVDETTLEQTASMLDGTKANLGHGKESRYLGKWSNARVVADRVMSVLSLSQSAGISPEGNLAAYFTSRARNEPDTLGISIAATLDRKQMRLDKRGDSYPLRLQSVRAADVVEDPAATTGGLFSIQGDFDMADDKLNERTEQLVRDIVQEMFQQQQQQPVDDDPALNQAKLKSFAGKFHRYPQHALEWVVELSELDAHRKYSELLENDIGQLETKIAELESKLELFKHYLGEDPLSASHEDSEQETEAEKRRREMVESNPFVNSHCFSAADREAFERSVTTSPIVTDRE